MDEVTVPASFRAMPRWWSEGTVWLDALPVALSSVCAAWRLTVDGAPMHGSNALVVPVTRDGDAFALRLTPPGPDVEQAIRALRFWSGHGTVALHDADTALGAMLLERLEASQSLAAVAPPEAMAVMGGLMRRLAIPASPDVLSTGALIERRAEELDAGGERIDRLDKAFVEAALACAVALAAPQGDTAVNGDMHSDQVLHGAHGRWTVIDPVLLRGDVAWDAARVLWTRLDEMSDAEIAANLDRLASAGEFDRERTRDLVVFRTVDYWLWGLDAGLTEDPERCRRLLSVLV